jgi:hypothetical protein
MANPGADFFFEHCPTTRQQLRSAVTGQKALYDFELELSCIFP